MIGAGAVGSAVATLLADQGRDVLLAGPALATDASRVAAGMIAPLSEAALDPASRDAASVMSAGALAWPAFAERFGIPLRACGGLLLSPSPQVGAVQPGEQVSLDLAQSLAPFLQRWDGSIRWLPDERAVDAEAALRRLEAQFTRRGGRRIDATLHPAADGTWQYAGGRIVARQTVIAMGQGSETLAGVAAELAVLTPIRGQILRTVPNVVPPGAPFVRGPGAYVAPQADGAVMIGATMEADIRSLTPSHETSQALMAAAATFAPGLETAGMTVRVGLRASTPDALPLVGPSRRAGLLLATGLRRNGWLLAPLVAGLIADYLAGKDPGPLARRLDPQRFERL